MSLPELPPIPNFDEWTDGAPLKPAALEWLNRLANGYDQIRAQVIANDAAVSALQTPVEEGGTAVTSDTSGYRFIESVEFTGSESVADFTGFDETQYDAYRFVLGNVVPVTDNVNLLMRYSFDGGSSFVSTGSYFYAGYFNTLASGGNVAGSAGTAMTLITLVGSAANEDGASGEFIIPHPHLSKATQTQHKMSAYDSAGTWYNSNTYGIQTTRSPMNAVRFLFSSGNFESGKITMYGLANSANV